MDLFELFNNIIVSTGFTCLDIACMIYIFKQLLKLVFFVFKKIKEAK